MLCERLGSNENDLMGPGPFFTFAGLAGILIGIFGKTFYDGDAFTMASFKRERRVSTWWGKSIFILVGLFFIALGVWFWLHGSTWSSIKE